VCRVSMAHGRLMARKPQVCATGANFGSGCTRLSPVSSHRGPGAGQMPQTWGRPAFPASIPSRLRGTSLGTRTARDHQARSAQPARLCRCRPGSTGRPECSRVGGSRLARSSLSRPCLHRVSRVSDTRSRPLL
jgi:hypothetical protein